MKKVIIALFVIIALAACKEQQPVYQFDESAVSIVDTAVIVKGDTYNQGVNSPTRGVTMSVQIKNTNDTTKTFIVSVKELK